MRMAPRRSVLLPKAVRVGQHDYWRYVMPFVVGDNAKTKSLPSGGRSLEAPRMLDVSLSMELCILGQRSDQRWGSSRSRPVGEWESDCPRGG